MMAAPCVKDTAMGPSRPRLYELLEQHTDIRLGDFGVSEALVGGTGSQAGSCMSCCRLHRGMMPCMHGQLHIQPL
jgi:hypothetical protein